MLAEPVDAAEATSRRLERGCACADPRVVARDGTLEELVRVGPDEEAPELLLGPVGVTWSVVTCRM